MNKEMIERAAKDAGIDLRHHYDETGLTIADLSKFLARIDAERGKGAVAEVCKFGIYRTMAGLFMPIGTKLFATPQPAIPEGMALMPVDPTPAMCDVIGNRYGAYETAEELYEALIAAAQGERNAD